MAYSTTSKYVQLTPYLLMEYMYADEPQPEEYFVNTGPTTVGYQKMINGYMSNAVQILNPVSDFDVTHNTLDNSVVQIATNSFVTLNSNLIIPFNDYSDKLTNTADLGITFPSNLLVVYDTVRYHIRAGYNLANIDGIIIQVQYQDQNLNYVTASQVMLKKGTAQEYEFSPSPITIGSNIYDKYFEIKLPNLKDMGDKYLAASDNFKPQTLASLISQSGTGFVQNSPIRISVWQIQSTVEFEGYERYDSTTIATLSLEQEDPFSNIGATIKESDQGQFFEYYATDNEGFIEDFILFQNSIGNNYYISHQIEVLEQIGAAIIETSRFESIQTTAYDVPNYYRPIVRNAAYASSFFLRYTMSLVNAVNQTRVIRISTYSSNTPAQWGTTITPIQLQNLPQVQKIYNRVYSQSQIQIGGGNTPQPKEIIKYTNVFVQQNYVTATFSNLSFTNGNLTDNTGTTQVTAYGQGKLTISISPFDNYYKFKFVKTGPDGVPTDIDLTNSGLFKIAFLDNAGNKTYIPSLLDNNVARPDKGEIAFKIDTTQSTKVLQFSDRRFFITNGNVTLSESQNVGTNTNSVSSASNSGIDSSIQAPSPESSSVIYWGYWKKDGETEVVVPTTPTTPTTPTETITPAVITSGTSGVVGSIGQTDPVGIVQSIKPAAVNGFGTSGTSGASTTTNAGSQLSGNALISALSAQIQGFKSAGWSDQVIISYFLTPGRPGYTQYPGLTKQQFKQAASGIISDASISSLFGGGPTRGQQR